MSWPNFKSGGLADVVAVRIRCSRCDTPIAIFGRSLLPDADANAVLWAILAGATASFQNDRDATVVDGEVHKIIVSCASKRQGLRCGGEVQRTLDRLADRLDAMHVTGRRAVDDLTE